ncbi:MAG: hypothetical protein ACLFU8_15465 [Anaerolineales bacterium]
MNKRVLLSWIVTLLLVAAPAATVLAQDSPWPGSGESLQVSPSDQARQVSLSLQDSHLALAWAGTDIQPGIFISERQPTMWTSPDIVTQAAGSRFPSLTHDGAGDLLIAWLEGEDAGQVMQMDVATQVTQTIASDIYGDAFPHLLVAPGGEHIVYAAAEIEANRTKTDLYHTYRPAGQDTWPGPTVVITRAQVQPGEPGGVWYPRAAVNTTDGRLHLVWEQTTQTISRTVWYISGAPVSGNVSWGTAQQLSPQGQMAVRPDVKMDANGVVHVVWSEIAEGTEASPLQQFINYRRLSGSTWSAAKRIDPTAVSVNYLYPTKATPRLALGSEQICAAWHGYRGETGKEDILLRCSKNSGLSWDTTFNVSENRNALSLMPAIQMDTDDELYVAWQDLTVGPITYWGAYFRTGRAEFRVYLPLVMRSK